MVSIRATGTNTSSKSIPYSCIYPLATSRALYLTMLPSALCLILNIYLRPIGLTPCGGTTRLQPSSLVIDRISYSHARIHSLSSFPSSKQRGSSFKVNSICSPSYSAMKGSENKVYKL